MQLRGFAKSKRSCDHCAAIILRYPTSSGTYFCDTSCKASWQSSQWASRRPSPEWLREAYWVKKMDCVQIGKDLGQDPKTIWLWLRNAGIETRKRGTTGNHRFVKRPYWKGRKLPKRMRQRLSEWHKQNGRCPAFINGVHWLKHYKGRKPASWRGGVTAERQAFYSTPAWKKAASEVWARDRKRCRRCGAKHSGKEPFDIHHIAPFSVKHLRCELTNLILVCEQCHYWIHSKENRRKKFIDESHSTGKW